MKAWGFEYKTNIVWLKVRKDGGPDGRGVGFYYRNVTELVLFGTRGHLRTAQAGRRMVNVIATMKQRHSQKPEELYDMIEHCSPAPFLELFARSTQAVELSGRLNIYAYDAYVLACAINQRAPLLTLDGGLRERARELKLDVLEANLR